MKNIFKPQLNQNGLTLGYNWQNNVCNITLTNNTSNEIAIGDITLFTAKTPFTPRPRCMERALICFPNMEVR